MIVCHCNVLKDSDIVSALDHETRPRTAIEAYRGLETQLELIAKPGED